MSRRSCYGQFMHRLAIAIPGLLLLGACTANTSTYPSLARRPAERITGTAEPATAVTEPNPEPPGAETTDRIAALVAQAQTADAKFVTGQAEARRLVESASDAEVDSTAWSNATVALASLASARSDAEVALAAWTGSMLRRAWPANRARQLPRRKHRSSNWSLVRIR
jgi:hypothetical protein